MAVFFLRGVDPGERRTGGVHGDAAAGDVLADAVDTVDGSGELGEIPVPRRGPGNATDIAAAPAQRVGKPGKVGRIARGLENGGGERRARFVVCESPQRIGEKGGIADEIVERTGEIRTERIETELVSGDHAGEFHVSGQGVVVVVGERRREPRSDLVLHPREPPRELRRPPQRPRVGISPRRDLPAGDERVEVSGVEFRASGIDHALEKFDVLPAFELRAARLQRSVQPSVKVCFFPLPDRADEREPRGNWKFLDFVLGNPRDELRLHPELQRKQPDSGCQGIYSFRFRRVEKDRCIATGQGGDHAPKFVHCRGRQTVEQDVIGKPFVLENVLQRIDCRQLRGGPVRPLAVHDPERFGPEFFGKLPLE